MNDKQMKIYMVGGSIRDRIMKRPVRDSDYVVIGISEKEFLDIFQTAKPVGKKKAVYIVDGNEYTLSHSKDIVQDLETRDLTINSIATDNEDRLFAHPRALDDIKNCILRPVKEENFFNDPLRVFRAARFYAELPDFSCSDDLLETMKKVGSSGKLKELTPERIGMEVLKAFASPIPSRFLKLLFQTNCLEPWLEELIRFPIIPAGPKPFHTGSLFDHTCEVMDKLAGNNLLVWMGFCHDLGKSLTDENKLPHHYGHEKTGIRLAETLGKRFRLPNKYIKSGMSASLWHMKAGQYADLRPGTKVDMLTQLSREDIFEEIFMLSLADRHSSNMELATMDLTTIMSIELPEEFKNLGEKSALKIRELRCQAISQNNRQNNKADNDSSDL